MIAACLQHCLSAAPRRTGFDWFNRVLLNMPAHAHRRIIVHSPSHIQRCVMRLSSVFRCIMLAGCILGMATSASASGSERNSAKASKEQIERGRYLVTIGGCNHCHSPKAMSPKGPIPHPMKILSGHQAESKLAEIPRGSLAPDKWMAMTNGDMTAWVGPWGVSFAANLTPDAATGLGGWTEEMFIKSLRTGKHMGTGRQILPPMPWEDIGHLTDTDLKDMFAYLMSVPPVRNAVPQPLPPPGSK
jgi:mono/diheme cytochrome c family protein